MKPEVQRLIWRSRRGLLELDILFYEYLSHFAQAWSKQQLDQFERLLAYQDQSLFDAFCDKVPLDDPQLNALFEQVKRYPLPKPQQPDYPHQV